MKRDLTSSKTQAGFTRDREHSHFIYGIIHYIDRRVAACSKANCKCYVNSCQSSTGNNFLSHHMLYGNSIYYSL